MRSGVTVRVGFSLLFMGLCGCQSAQPVREAASATSKTASNPDSSVPAAPVPADLPSVAQPPAVALPPAGNLVQSDPQAFFQYSLEQCRKLDGYALLFVRQERRGLFKTLQPAERIQTWFRRSPFSVRMKWLDPGIKYGESTYVEGKNEGRVLFVPADIPLNLPQRIYRVSPATPVSWGECRYPVTDFGIELLLKHTLETIADDPTAKLSYLGEVTPPDDARRAHCIRIDYSPKKHPAPLQKLYFDVQSNLPIRTEMLFADGAIDTIYAYHDLRNDRVLTDDDFVLEYEKARAAQTTAGSNP